MGCVCQAVCKTQRTQWFSHTAAGMDSPGFSWSCVYPGIQLSWLCRRTVKAKDTLCCVVSDWGRLNSLINSIYQWLDWSKVLFIGSKSNTVLVLDYLVQHLVLVRKLNRVFKEQIYREDTAFFMKFLHMETQFNPLLPQKNAGQFL